LWEKGGGVPGRKRRSGKGKKNWTHQLVPRLKKEGVVSDESGGAEKEKRIVSQRAKGKKAPAPCPRKGGGKKRKGEKNTPSGS